MLVRDGTRRSGGIRAGSHRDLDERRLKKSPNTIIQGKKTKSHKKSENKA